MNFTICSHANQPKLVFCAVYKQTEKKPVCEVFLIVNKYKTHHKFMLTAHLEIVKMIEFNVDVWKNMHAVG